MRKYQCIVCGFVYDESEGIPEDGIAPGTRWEDIPDDWVCPVCGVGKDQFEVVEGFRAWSIQEDVALGPNFSIGAVASLPAFGGDIERFLLDGRFDMGVRWDSWLMLGDVWVSGRVDEGQTNNWIGGVMVGVAQLGRRGFQFRALYENSYRLDRDRQSPAETRLQPFLEARHLLGVTITGHDYLLLAFQQGVESMKKFLLGTFFTGKKLDIIDQ